MSVIEKNKFRNKSNTFNLNFPRAYPNLGCHGSIKQAYADFKVDEVLGFELSEDGEHIYLNIEKENKNTLDICHQLSKICGISVNDIGYTGLKDKQALTTQWFSIPLIVDKKLAEIEQQDFIVRIVGRHRKKLKPGMHKENVFNLWVRNIEGNTALLHDRLGLIVSQGVPNYFGHQRFGNQGRNLDKAEMLLARLRGKQKSKWNRLMVSVARSWIFNQILSQRVLDQTWFTCIEGEPLMLPSAPMWGRGKPSSSGLCQVLEESIIADYQHWADFLEHCGLRQERRHLQLIPSSLTWSLLEKDLNIRFKLPSGSYATSVLREILNIRQ